MKILRAFFFAAFAVCGCGTAFAQLPAYELEFRDITATNVESILLKTPEGYDDYDNRTRLYPLFIFGCGDGAKSNDPGYHTVTNEAVAGTSPNFSDTFQGNDGGQDILRTSVVFSDAGGDFAYGDFAGDIRLYSDNSDIGNYNATSANGAFSFTFAATGSVVVDYVFSASLFEGPPLYFNSGDNPADIPGQDFKIACFFASMVLDSASGDFSSGDVVSVIDYMIAQGYRIDLTRIYYTGLSRGGFVIDDLMRFEFNRIAAYSSAAGHLTVSPTGWPVPWFNDRQINRGVIAVHGETDGTVANTINGLATGFNSRQDMVAPPLFRVVEDQGHAAAVWHTNLYNRLERTDATGTAIFDYIWLSSRFSTGQRKQATLFTEYAEMTLLIEDYRLAQLQVDRVAAGDFKDALQARLDAIKPVIDKCGRRFYVNFGDQNFGSGTVTISPGWNNRTTNTADIANLIDDTGVVSTIDFDLVNATGAETFDVDVRGNYFGMPRDAWGQGDGFVVATTNGEFQLEQLDGTKEYDLWLYHTSGAAVTTDRYTRFEVNSVQIEQYSNFNSFEYAFYENQVPDGSDIITVLSDHVNLETDNNAFIPLIMFLEHDPGGCP